MRRKLPKRVEREVEGYVTRWRVWLFLNEWDFSVDGAPQPEDDAEAHAETEIDLRYKHCHIRIFPRWETRPQREREFAILHELCHCIVDRIDSIFCRLQNGMHVTRQERYDAREEVTQGFASVIWSLPRPKKERNT